jgi:hypothetical protein
MIQEKKKHKKSKKKPSAMAQVHNRVNAGVMDGVVYGGMMEGAEPEKDKYEIVFEDGGLEPFGHAVNESTDCVRFGEHYYDCYFSNAIAFMSLLRKDGTKGRIFVAPPGNLHGNLKAYLIGNKEISPEEYGRPSELKSDEKRTGRFWFGDGCNIISFYSYPESTKQIYNNCVEALIAIKEKTGEDFNIGEVMVDLWTKSIRNPIIMPVRWFNNGMADTFLPIAKKCEPYEDFDGSFKYRVETAKGNFTADWKGDDVEEEQGYGVNENRKRLYITESQMRQIEVLLENEGTNMKRARRYLESEGYTDPKKRQQILDNIRTNIPNSRLQQCRFLLGVTRMYVDGELNNPNAIFELNKTLKYIASDAHVKEYDYNLNGETLQTLVNRFKSVASDDLKQSIAKSNSKQLTVNNLYTIVPIDYPEEASKYGKYTSWCVTHSSDMYNKYTNDGTGRFYFCLREGFENELAVKGDNCPLDNYGLSMIAVSINLDGSVNTITCRWNHDNGGNDSIMNVDELENLLGRNFYQTFKPYTREELHAKGVILFDEVQGLLDSGGRPQDIFERVDNFKNGFARVCLNRKWNFMSTEGKILSGQWFDAVHNFRDGFACVYLNGKWNLINTESKILSGQWFDEAYEFKDGFARVCLNRKWNFMSTEGKILSGQWFDRVYDFKNGFAPVCLNEKWNLVNMEGKILSDQWFDYVLEPENGFVCVYLNDKWNFINMEGKILSDQWFDKAYDFNNGFALVCLDGKLYKINTNGEISDINESKTKKTITITEESRVVNESAGRNRDDMGEKNIEVDYKKYIKSLIEFMREQHLRIDPLPSIELNPEEQDGIFVKTGYYSPDEQKVVVFTDGRHPKDILRTVAHEFIHHMQNLQNPNKDWGTGGDLEADSKLRSIEGEAFLLGNIIFREWTEKMKKTKELNESINIKKALEDLKERRDPDGIEDWDKLNEIESEIVEPDDVDLSSFNIKKHLNPKFWDNGHLDTRIRLKLLDIADDFFDSLDVDWVEPVDVIITGSIANYNWNKNYSDIDLHILVDYEDVDERVDFVREYFTLKKNAWNEKHKNLRIFGFPVEVYVQDANEPHASSGVYSIDKDKWLTEPDFDKLRSGKVDKRHVREMVSTYMNKIDCLIDIYKKHKDDEHEMKEVAKDAAEIFNEIKKMRQDDLAKYGREMCDGNIIFKALRRSDYIGKLIKLKDLTYDKINSL